MRNNYNRDADNNYTKYAVTENAPLLEYLLANVKESRSKIKATLQGRGVKVNGKVVTQFDYSLQPGMTVSVSKRKQKNTLKNPFVKIVYEDKWIIVIEKKEGILSTAAGHSALNVKKILDDYLNKTAKRSTAHVVHRLDRDTSGLMIYAKDIETEQILEHNWHEIVFDRRYVAVVSGEIVEDGGTVSSWLKDNKAYFTYSSPTDNGGKFAVTHFRVINRTTEHSLVEFALETGRKNQIRVHASDIGHPICGDNKYGNGDNPAHRLCLHAFMLYFFHPVTGERMEFETPIPTVFKNVLKRDITANRHDKQTFNK